jgi:hypothetical protein
MSHDRGGSVSTTDRDGSKRGDQTFGPDAAAILSTEHWSLLTARTLLINEGLQRTTVALALLSDATSFGRRSLTFASCSCRRCCS